MDDAAGVVKSQQEMIATSELGEYCRGTLAYRVTGTHTNQQLSPCLRTG